MGRGRLGTIAVAVCLVLTVGQPGALDQVRYPVALVLSWPARALGAWLGPTPRTPAQLTANAALLAYRWRQATRDDPLSEGFLIFAVDEDQQSFFIVGGWDQDLRRGAVVHDGNQLIGFVDLVFEEVSRVRLITHPSSHVAGRIELPADVALPRATSPDLLLSGGSTAGLVPRQGCRIHKQFERHTVRYLDDKGLWNLKIGVIARDEALARLVVKPSLDIEDIDRVLIGDATGKAQGLGGIRDLSARVLSLAPTSVASSTWLLSRGSQDGVRAGAWVSCGGALVGRIGRVGVFSCHMRPIQIELDRVDCRVIDTNARVLGHALWQDATGIKAIVGQYFSRGRSPKNGLPAGLWVGSADANGAWQAPQVPGIGEVVTIHGPIPRRTCLRLGLGR